VTIKASQHGLVKGSTAITEVKSTKPNGAYTMLGTDWSMTLPPGVYDITYAGRGLTINGSDTEVGSAVVRAGDTTTAPVQRFPACS
jgi:hypothetical protein